MGTLVGGAVEGSEGRKVLLNSSEEEDFGLRGHGGGAGRLW